MKMGLDYCIWLDNEVNKYYGTRLFQKTNAQEVVDRFTPKWVSIKPPKGDIFIVEVDGKVAGMGRLSTLEEGVGGLHNIWVEPAYRGRKLATMLMMHIEEKAREFGFSVLRLDTAKFNKPAQSLYKKLGYYEILRFTPFGAFENDSLARYYAEKVYMEKKL
jgi:ribosomal protein S18 acetylase RimI-like enzyme